MHRSTNIKGAIMEISYNKLFKLLIDRNLKKTEFAEIADISGTTLAKLSNNQYVSMEVLLKVCRALDITFDDFIEILPENEGTEE